MYLCMHVRFEPHHHNISIFIFIQFSFSYSGYTNEYVKMFFNFFLLYIKKLCKFLE